MRLNSAVVRSTKHHEIPVIEPSAQNDQSDRHAISQMKPIPEKAEQVSPTRNQVGGGRAPRLEESPSMSAGSAVSDHLPVAPQYSKSIYQSNNDDLLISNANQARDSHQTLKTVQKRTGTSHQASYKSSARSTG